jgi:hypothetical protein
MMPPHRYNIPPLAAAALVLCLPEPAHACGALPCAQFNEIQPPDGSIGVPRNTELRVLYFGTLEQLSEAEQAQPVDVSSMRLVPSEGEPIVLTGSLFERPDAYQAWVVARQPAPLAAETTYELQLLLTGRDPCASDGREWTTVSSFTTGAVEDHEAPTFARIEDIGYGGFQFSESTCGTVEVIPVLPEFRPASDAAPAIRYDIYVNGVVAQRYVDLAVSPQNANAAIFVDCGTQSLVTATHVATGDLLELRAVDLAGNESPSNEAIAIEASCLPPPADPGLTPPASSQPFIPPTGEDEVLLPRRATPSRGCAIVHERGPAPMLMLAALLSMLPMLRRRR